jgi:predicted O-linked N-acetylglucosamine transferase (SPINDLY family)
LSIFGRLIGGVLGGRKASHLRRDADTACAEATRALKQGRTAEALAHFERALELEPHNFSAHSGLGVLRFRAGEPQRSLTHLLQALRARPETREIALLAAQLLRQAHRARQSVEVLTPVAAASPGDPEIELEMARALRDLGEPDAALQRLGALCAQHPAHIVALEELAVVNRDCGRIDEALEAYRRVAALAPDHPTAHGAVLFHELYREHDRAAQLRAHRAWAERFAPSRLARTQHRNRADPERAIRLGYLSADFGLTSAARFIEPLLAYADRKGFALSCYHASAREDAVTRRFASYASSWRDVEGLSDQQLCDRVLADEIDVLVDLNGHTRGNRLTALAHRPAPVQLTYLGYGASTGVDAIGYRVTDGAIDPAGDADRWYSEKLLRLPGSMWCYAPPDDAPEVRPLPASAKGHITFGSLNNIAKIGAGVLDTWSEIAARGAGSRFVFAGVPAGIARTRISAAFAQRGVSVERLEFHDRVTAKRYYALYHEVDVALDSFPYNGAATTCDALWMGVPVLTLAGEHALARSGLSLLSSLGMREWVAASPGDYVARALQCTQDIGQLATLRAELRQRLQRSPLCDGPSFVAAFENLIRHAWRQWCAQATART